MTAAVCTADARLRTTGSSTRRSSRRRAHRRAASTGSATPLDRRSCDGRSVGDLRLAPVHDVRDPRRAAGRSRASCTRRRASTAPAPWRTYWRHRALPLLRPALLVAVVLNVIYVFNSFPIIWIMTQGGPGQRHRHDGHVRLQARVHATTRSTRPRRCRCSTSCALLVVVAVVRRRRRPALARGGERDRAAAAHRRCWPRRGALLAVAFFLFPYVGDAARRRCKPDSRAGQRSRRAAARRTGQPSNFVDVWDGGADSPST